jgi:hypothetical protein
MPDGRILKPGVPIMSIDDEFYHRNFGGPLQDYSNVREREREIFLVICLNKHF